MTMPSTARSNSRGTAVVEFALAAPLLLLLAAGVLDFAMALRTATAVADAARAGAQYGSLSATNASDTAGIRAAALAAAPGIAGMTATVVKSCQCPGVGAVSCAGTCTGGAMQVYVQVTTQATAPTVFRYAGVPFSGAVTSRASMRAR
jgi:Flp pilus assembly protein TadG